MCIFSPLMFYLCGVRVCFELVFMFWAGGRLCCVLCWWCVRLLLLYIIIYYYIIYYIILLYYYILTYTLLPLLPYTLPILYLPPSSISSSYTILLIHSILVDTYIYLLIFPPLLSPIPPLLPSHTLPPSSQPSIFPYHPFLIHSILVGSYLCLLIFFPFPNSPRMFYLCWGWLRLCGFDVCVRIMFWGGVSCFELEWCSFRLLYYYYIIVIIYYILLYTILFSSSDLFSSLNPSQPSLIHPILVGIYICLLISFFPTFPSHPVSVEIQSNTLQSSLLPSSQSSPTLIHSSSSTSHLLLIHSILVGTYIYLLIFHTHLS